MGNIFSKFFIEELIITGNSKEVIAICIDKSSGFIQSVIDKNIVLTAVQVWKIRSEFDIDIFSIMLNEDNNNPEIFSEYFRSKYFT